MGDARGLGSTAKDMLFEACYENGENISTIEGLRPIATRLEALGADGAVAHLVDEKGMDELTAALRQKSPMGKRISGVPYFVVQNEIVVSGAQESAGWLRIFQRVAA